MLQDFTNKSKTMVMDLVRFQQPRAFAVNANNNIMMIKVILLIFYFLGLIAMITLSGIAFKDISKSENWNGMLSTPNAAAVISLGLIYQLIIFGVGLYAVLKENFTLMLVWTAMDAISVIAHGAWYSWMSALLMTFTTVLNGIYAFMVYKKSKQIEPEVNHGIHTIN